MTCNGRNLGSIDVPTAEGNAARHLLFAACERRATMTRRIQPTGHRSSSSARARQDEPALLPATARKLSSPWSRAIRVGAPAPTQPAAICARISPVTFSLSVRVKTTPGPSVHNSRLLSGDPRTKISGASLVRRVALRALSCLVWIVLCTWYGSCFARGMGRALHVVWGRALHVVWGRALHVAWPEPACLVNRSQTWLQSHTIARHILFDAIWPTHIFVPGIAWPRPVPGSTAQHALRLPRRLARREPADCADFANNRSRPTHTLAGTTILPRSLPNGSTSFTASPPTLAD